MDELIGRLVADSGVDRATAEKAVGIVFDFLVRESSYETLQPVLSRLPGADALMRAASTDGGAAGGGIFGAGMRMMSAGLTLNQAQNVARQVLAYSRDKAGAEAVGAAVAAIPGLAQFV